ncbi:hypothetical protein SY27_04955 [Flavobacterium sp. 316]|uniref:hypothetical protein n=1 Tax=Flavobacterium sp. 316 TaxID=1603293 RepID=UPI0005E05E6A|nr:hypothetical protein [Flavobacterium sp. 316]KIX22026.1 hypothetical protein SY27_04955 [Flavobacterium sp. 316]
MNLIRFWFNFEKSNPIPLGLHLGCGVTAYNYDDALLILRSKIFKNDYRMTIKDYIQDVDLRTLDSHHILPNILPPNNRGIWYPIGY